MSLRHTFLRLFAGAACVLSVPAIAADLDPNIYVDDANFAKPAELGTGWYLRGDVAYNIDQEQKREFTYDSGSSNTNGFNRSESLYGDSFGFGVGFGKQISPLFRVDLTLDRPVASSREDFGLRGFSGQRQVETNYVDYGDPTDPSDDTVVTATREIAFNESGYVFSSQCQDGLAGFSGPDLSGCPRVGETVTDLVGGSETLVAEYSIWTLLANAYFDLPTVGKVTPYVGAGLGMSRANYAVQYTVNCNPTDNEACGFPAGGYGEDIEDSVLVDSNNARWLPTYAFHAGVSYPVTHNMSVDVGYRFQHIDGVEDVVDGTHADFVAENHENIHSIRAGIRFSTW